MQSQQCQGQLLQRHRANAPADIPYEYWLRNVYLPFLDHILVGIDSRFDKYGVVVNRMAALIPAIIVTVMILTSQKFLYIYSDDLPSPNCAEEEFICSRREWLLFDRKSTQSVRFPFLPEYLHTTAEWNHCSHVCECERLGSVLKRLNTSIYGPDKTKWTSVFTHKSQRLHK